MSSAQLSLAGRSSTLWHLTDYCSAARRLRLGQQSGADIVRPVAHSLKPKSLAFHAHAVQAASVVSHLEFEHLWVDEHRNIDARRIRMFDRIRDRFLGDSVHVIAVIDAHCDFGLQTKSQGESGTWRTAEAVRRLFYLAGTIHVRCRDRSQAHAW